MNDKYLMAVVRIPVRVTSDGDLILLNDYSKINIEKMDEILRKTGDTIYSKVIDYLDKAIKEEEEEEVIKKEETTEEEEVIKKEETTEEEEVIKKEETKEEEEEKTEPILYEFPYIKKSKKPLNATFRARLKSQNFTKKVYSH
jgi:hypothetical protein